MNHSSAGGDAAFCALRFGALLRDRRRMARLTQQDVAEKLHVNPNTVKNWEYDRTKPDHDLIPPLCSLLGIRLDELYQAAPDGAPSALEERVVRHLRLLDPADRKALDKMISVMVDERQHARQAAMREAFRLFLIRPGSAAAGIGDEVPQEPPSYTFLRRNAANSRADGVVRVRGRSMEPVYQDGDYVYFRNASSARSGEDVIVDTEEGAVIKRVSADGTLYSVNPDLPYPARNDQNTLVIRGRVLGIVQSSDHPGREESALLEDLFADDIRSFRQAYGLEA
ncbi:MAG: helix-turn-helix domain-containing protein [Clostridia bacterium]|nr:helix-turn-helix domain-containing protein [Clostridia bacterium]MBQ6722161.1 helix-turn-helix domain-containing protein [Clostridia bacterium]